MTEQTKQLFPAALFSIGAFAGEDSRYAIGHVQVVERDGKHVCYATDGRWAIEVTEDVPEEASARKFPNMADVFTAPTGTPVKLDIHRLARLFAALAAMAQNETAYAKPWFNGPEGAVQIELRGQYRSRKDAPLARVVIMPILSDETLDETGMEAFRIATEDDDD